MNREEKKAAVLQAVKNVPLISNVAARLLQLASDPDHGLMEVVEIVKYDAALTSHVLKVVNSAAFSRKAVINSIDRAVSLLGEDMLIGIAMSEAAALLFGKELEGYAAEAGSLWIHDMKAAIAAKKIAVFAGGAVNGDLAFTCGLLHDLGKGVISDFLKDTPQKIQNALAEGKFPDYVSAERGIVGVDHAEVGYLLCKNWNLPEPLPEVIRYHHEPALALEEIRPLVYAAHLGNIVATMAGSGTGADALQNKLDGSYVQFIELGDDDLARVMLEVEQEFATVSTVLLGEGGEINAHRHS